MPIMWSWLTGTLARRVAVLTSAAAVVALTAATVLLAYFLPARHTISVTALVVSGCAAAIAVVTLTTALIVRRTLSASLRDLTEAVGAAATGRFLARARSTRPDEIGALSRAVDQLCAKITDLSVAVIDTDRELAATRHELRLKDALSLLFELIHAIDTETDLDTLVRTIPRTIAPAMGLEEMAILLYDEASDAFVVRATYGFGTADRVEGVSFSRGEGISGLVASTDKPLVIPDTNQDQRYLHYKGRHRTTGSFACVPMRLQGRLTGLFHVLRPEVGAFSSADVDLLTSLASYTALAIAHAETSVRLRELSLTDEVTGVANRRLLLERAADEVERARRGHKPLSALMVDIDDWQRIHDELGHARADDVLRAVSRALRDSLRRVDTVARYGGEEFGVLLPDSPKAQALLVAEKLRASVAALAGLGHPVTVSVGIATLPGDAEDHLALLDAAGRALLAAQRAGCGQVMSYDARLAATVSN